MSNSSPRITREKKTIEAMLRIYCRLHHGSRGTLCASCSEMLSYARQRLDSCPFQEEKPACNRCQVHCYSRSKQEQVKRTMRAAGPRMLHRHPILSIFHFLDKFCKPPTLKKKR